MPKNLIPVLILIVCIAVYLVFRFLVFGKDPGGPAQGNGTDIDSSRSSE